MNENLSAAAGLLSGAALDPEVETPAVPDDAKPPPDESQESAKGEPDTPELPAAAAQAQETDQPTLTVKALAEKLELRPQDLYQQLMIDVGSGEQLSLSQVKDAGAKLHKAETILADAETHRQDAENELLRHQHAASLVKPTDAQLQAADEQWVGYVRSENAKTLSVISAWHDPAQQSADLGEMSKLLTSYGVSKAEIARYADHRMVKQLYDHMTLRRRLDAATAAEVTKHPAPVGKAKRKSAPQTGAKAVEQFKAGKITHTDAVRALIAEG